MARKTPTRCTARRRNNRPCRAWAVRGSRPPLCIVHGGRPAAEGTPRESVPAEAVQPSRGFYRRAYTLGEIADLVDNVVDETLADELAATRVAVRRVMEQLQEELPPAEYARLAALVFDGANTIARLLRARRALAGQAADSIAAAIAQALNEIGTELGIEL